MSEALRAFTLGQDTQLVIMAPSGRIDLAHVKGFTAQRNSTASGGWYGWFELERTDPLQELIDSEPDEPATMYQYATRADGSIATYQYTGVEFSTGTFSDIPDRIEFAASGMHRI